jgi:hypothetical protein
MATKFADFLSEKKIDTRRLLAASRILERLQPPDRKIRLAKAQARKSEDSNKKKEGDAAKKPRSGRPVTQRAIDAAIVGKAVSSATRTRILRAINRLLGQKKQEAVQLSALFDATPGKPKKKANAPE